MDSRGKIKVSPAEIQREAELLGRFRKAIARFPDWKDRIVSRDVEFYRYLETVMVDPTLPRGGRFQKLKVQQMSTAKRIIWKIYLNLKAGRAPFDRGFDWLSGSPPKRPMAKPRRKG
jgi:hypothetical protein